MPISGIIDKTVVQIANATGIGYRHNGSMRFSNKLACAFSFNLTVNKLLDYVFSYRKTFKFNNQFQQNNNCVY